MARFLRIKPVEWHGAIALRTEIYGCMRGKLFYAVEPSRFVVGNSRDTFGDKRSSFGGNSFLFTKPAFFVGRDVPE